MLIKLNYILALFFIFGEGYASVYYVDYDKGNNKNTGTKKHSPLKNYPGDPEATARASNIRLKPGDKIIFKGGVKYKGTLYIKSSGTQDLPIIFDGNLKGDFGGGMAIIDGSDVVSNTYKCKHPVKEEMIFCVRKEKLENSSALSIFSGNMKLYESNVFNIKDYYIQDNLGKFTTANSNDVGHGYLKVKDDDFEGLLGSWSNASLIIWGKGNQIYRRNIIRIDEKTKRIYFKPVSFYKDKKYIIVNTASSLDALGEYYYDSKKNIIYMIPYGEQNTEVSYASRKVGVDISADNIVVSGFIIEKNGSVDNVGRVGMGMKVYGKNKFNPIRNIKIDGNIFRYHNAIDKSGVITILNGENIQINNNIIKRSSPNRGILAMNSDNVVTKQNHISDIAGTGIAYFGVNNGQIEANTINKINGVHSNGISIYLGSKNNYVFNNCVANGLSAFTSNNAISTVIYANIFHTNVDNYTVADWGGSHDIYFYNNVVLNSYSKSLYLSKYTTGIKILNSVIDGLLIDNNDAVISHNIYTKLAWLQNSRYKWKPGVGDILKYVGAADKKVTFTYPHAGVKIKLPFDKNLVPMNIGYPFEVRGSCKQLIK